MAIDASEECVGLWVVRSRVGNDDIGRGWVRYTMGNGNSERGRERHDLLSFSISFFFFLTV